MRSPSVTIACLMGTVVVFAVDIALMRKGFRDPYAIFYILGVVPTANLVMIALLAESLRVRRRGKGQPFWTGFVFSGGLAIAVTSSFVPLTFAEPAWLVLRAFWLVLGQTNYQRLILPGVDLICISLVYTFPQVLFAVLGGWLFRKFRLVIVRDECSRPCLWGSGREPTKLVSEPKSTSGQDPVSAVSGSVYPSPAEQSFSHGSHPPFLSSEEPHAGSTTVVLGFLT